MDPHASPGLTHLAWKIGEVKQTNTESPLLLLWMLWGKLTFRFSFFFEETVMIKLNKYDRDSTLFCVLSLNRIFEDYLTLSRTNRKRN